MGKIFDYFIIAQQGPTLTEIKENFALHHFQVPVFGSRDYYIPMEVLNFLFKNSLELSCKLPKFGKYEFDVVMYYLRNMDKNFTHETQTGTDVLWTLTVPNGTEVAVETQV
jgi:hypothetical protein